MILNRFRSKNSNVYDATGGVAQSELIKGGEGSEEWHELYISDSLNNNSTADTNSNAQLRTVVWNDQVADNNQRTSAQAHPSSSATQDIIKTAIGEGTIIEGKFKFDSPVKIDGELTGEVVSSSVLIVGETAVIKAHVQVGSLIVYGKVIGDVVAEELVSIKTDGMLEGNIRTKRISIDDGGYFKGLVNA